MKSKILLAVCLLLAAVLSFSACGLFGREEETLYTVTLDANGGIYKCYSTGNLNVSEATSGKGGFAAYNDGNINSCFSGVSIVATNADKYGAFVGNVGTASYTTNCYYSNKATFTTSGEPQTFENTYAETANPLLDLSVEEFLVNTLGWSGDIWDFDENGFNYPVLK